MALDPQDKQDIVDAISAGFKSIKMPSSGTSSSDSGGKKDFGTKEIDASVSGVARVLQQGGGRIDKAAKDIAGLVPTDLLKNIAGAGVSAISYIENTQDTFRALSKVGAGLNGNLGELQITASKTRMPIDTFANMVGNNSTLLAGFGRGVSDGAKNFANLSNAMYEEGVIEGFMNLGMTVEEANEFVLKNTELTRRQSRLTNMDAGEQAKAAADLAKNMQIVAKLTGKDAAQLQDDLIARQRNGATQAKLRLLEMDGVQGAQEAYNKTQNALDAGPGILKNLFDDLMQTGAPMTEATKNFAATNQEAYALAKQAAEANKRGDVAEAQRLGAEAAAAANKFAQSRQGLTLATLAQSSDIAKGQADVLEEMGPVIDSTLATMKKIKDAGGGELTFREAFLKNLKDIGGETTTQMKGEGVGQEASVAVNKGQVQLANLAAKGQEKLGEHIQTNTILLKTYSTMIENLKPTLGGAATQIIDGIDALIPGTKLSEQMGKIDMFSDKLKEAGLMQENTMKLLATVLDSNVTPAAKKLAEAALMEQGVINENLQLTEKFAAGLQKARTDNSGTQTPENEEGSSLGMLNKLWNWITGDEQQNAFGTGGFKDFGKGKAAMLHGLEAVVPKDSPQGALLESFPGGLGDLTAQIQNMGNKFDPSAMKNLASDMAATGAPMGQAAQEMMASMSSPNTSTQGNTNEDLSETINQTLQQLVQINTRQLTEIQKQVKATKGMSGNVLSNVGI